MVDHIVRITFDPQADDDIDTQEKLKGFVEFCLKTWPLANRAEFTVEVSKPITGSCAMVLDDSETYGQLSGCSIHETDDNDDINVGDGSDSIFYFA